MRLSELELRRLGAEYLCAHVSDDEEGLSRLACSSSPDKLVAALALAAQALAIHVADVEGTTVEVVVGAYRDVWFGST
jgi:hypothetical protein